MWSITSNATSTTTTPTRNYYRNIKYVSDDPKERSRIDGDIRAIDIGGSDSTASTIAYTT